MDVGRQINSRVKESFLSFLLIKDKRVSEKWLSTRLLLLAFLQGYGGKWRRFSNVSSTVGGKARAPRRGGSVSTMAAAFAGFSGRPGSGRELEGMQFSSGVLCAFHRFDDELSRQGRLRGLDERGSGREDRYRAREMTTFLRAFAQFR